MNIGIILSGGVGKRMAIGFPKQYIYIKGKMVIEYTVRNMSLSNVDYIDIVMSKEYEHIFNLLKSRYPKIRNLIPSGETRFESIYNGLMANEGNNVVINDAVRPVVESTVLNILLDNLHKYDYVAYSEPITAYLSTVDLEPLDRSKYLLYSAPEGLSKNAVKKILNLPKEELNQQSFNGTLELIKKVGISNVKLINFNFFPNPKLTFQSDIKIIESYLPKLE